MLDPGVLAFVRGALPAPPARVLEIGAGDGALAAALRESGYDVTAIDPKAVDGTGVERRALLDVTGSFDAAVAIVSLHHVEPLADSCAQLAGLVRPGGALIVDELDVGRYDERVTTW
jgi:2-polyprenyl-3-methyl-5-hydroxy-6-metoxy-1,4-benzoquinol methylase